MCVQQWRPLHIYAHMCLYALVCVCVLHCDVEVTELSTNKQHTLSRARGGWGGALSSARASVFVLVSVCMVWWFVCVHVCVCMCMCACMRVCMCNCA